MSHCGAVNFPAVRERVQLAADGPHQVGEGAVLAGGGAVVEVKAEAALPWNPLGKTAVASSLSFAIIVGT